jgi:outer membrane protein assembly factor BamB
MRPLSVIKTKLLLLAALSLFSPVFHGVEARELMLSRPLVLKWFLEKSDLIAVPPGFQGESLYVQTSDGVVTSVQLPGGRLRWRGDVGGTLLTTPVADERAVYVASEPVSGGGNNSQGLLTALSKVSGITVWSRTLTSPLQSNLLLLNNSLFGATKDGLLLSVSAETGETVWSTKFPYHISENILISGQKLILSTPDGTITSFDCRTGRTLWRYQTRDALRGAMAAAGSAVFVGSANGYVTALEESADGVAFRWRRRVGTSVVGVSHTARGLIAVTGDNFVQMLSLKRGTRLWKRGMPGRVFAQPLNDSGNALFATLGGEVCIVLSLDRGRQVNLLSVGEGNSIVAMPVLTQSALIIPTRAGLMAFAPPSAD